MLFFIFLFYFHFLPLRNLASYVFEVSWYAGQYEASPPLNCKGQAQRDAVGQPLQLSGGEAIVQKAWQKSQRQTKTDGESQDVEKRKVPP